MEIEDASEREGRGGNRGRVFGKQRACGGSRDWLSERRTLLEKRRVKPLLVPAIWNFNEGAVCVMKTLTALRMLLE